MKVKLTHIETEASLDSGFPKEPLALLDLESLSINGHSLEMSLLKPNKFRQVP